MTASLRILVIDNDDSFVHTLCGYLVELGARLDVRRSRDIPDAEVAALLADYDGVLVSPGPGAPAEAGVSLAAVRAAATAGTPLLGVCLGHQALAEAFGATVAIAPELMHGKTSLVRHEGEGVFAGLPSPFVATRYHSLAVVDGTIPDELVVTARTGSGVVMGLRHRHLPLEGVQFHPESVLTEGGYRVLANWLAALGMPDAVAASARLHPLVGAEPIRVAD